MEKVLQLEEQLSFEFFWSDKNTNTDENSKGYGLVIDRTNKKDHASMASVGFALSAYVIGVERGYVTKEEALKRVTGTLKTLLYNVPHYKGFFVHFVDMFTAERYRKSEFTTIDTAYVLNGALSCDSYFDDPIVHQLVEGLFNRIEWNEFVFEHNGRKMFHMSYNPDKDGAYANGKAGFIYQWEMPAEQLSMYFLAAASQSIDENTARDLYNGFYRYAGGYKDYQFIYTPGGALFTYQFSHAWIDFGKYVDSHGFDWFENSRRATLANRQFCIDNMKNFKTFNENSWGLTACDHPHGYAAFGPEPLGWDFKPKSNVNGTVAPNAVFGSLPFAPKECLQAINYMYKNFPSLFGEFGFKDSYNLENEPWFCDNYLGLDKGISLLMTDNYLYQTTWKYYMKHPLIQKAVNVLHFSAK